MPTMKKQKEKKPKQDINKEYPKWAWVDYKYQDVEFFKEVKKLVVEGLDTKHELMNGHVITIDIASFFGNVKTFKTKNPLLPLDAKNKITTLYWKINDTSHITNNELMVWFVKGWIIDIRDIPLTRLKLLQLQRRRFDAKAQ
jgi:hypothetical protein